MFRRRNRSYGQKLRQSNLLTNLALAKGTIFQDWIKYWIEEREALRGDVFIQVGCQRYQLHSDFLSFWSKYFQELFTVKTNLITLTNIEKKNFEVIVDFLYYGVLELNVDDVKDTLLLADQYEIESIVLACCDFIIDHLSEMKNILELMELLCRSNIKSWMADLRTRIIEKWPELYSMNVLSSIFSHYVKDIDNIVDIVEFLCCEANLPWMMEIRTKIMRKWPEIYSTDVLRRISIDALKIYVNVNSGDIDLIDICCEWVNQNIAERSCYIPDLVNCIIGNNRTIDDFSFQQPTNENDVKLVFHEMSNYLQEVFLDNFQLRAKYETREKEEEKDRKRFSKEELHFMNWRKCMKVLRHSSRSANTIIQIQDKQYRLENWILSISSKFFRSKSTMFEFEQKIHLDIDPNDFEAVVNFMYGKMLHITSNNLHNLIRASRYLQMDSCRKLIGQFIDEHLQIANIFQILNVFAEQHDELYNSMKRKIVKNFKGNESDLFCLDVKCLKTILSLDISIANEVRLALCRRWVEHDVINRLIYVPELMKSMQKYLNDDIKKISEFNSNLRKQLFEYFHLKPNDFDDQVTSFGVPFEIRLPLMRSSELNQETNNSKNDKQSRYGKPFKIILSTRWKIV